MKNLSIIIFLAFLTIPQLQAQLQFNLSLLSDNETFLVSMSSETTIEAPLNRTSNGQIVLNIIGDEPFTAGNIESLVPGVTWTDNVYLEESNQPNLPRLMAFAMQESSTTNFVYEANVEVPLFTFKNQHGACPGIIELTDNEDDVVILAKENGFNFTQNFTVLETRGNAFSSIGNSTVDCNDIFINTIEQDLVKDVKIYPIPTAQELTIEWTNDQNQDHLNLEVLDIHGKLLQTVSVDGITGEQKHTLNLDRLNSGVLMVRFKNDQFIGQYFKIVKR